MLLRGGTRRIIASAFFGAMTNAWVGPLNTNSKVLSSYSRRVRELQQAKDEQQQDLEEASPSGVGQSALASRLAGGFGPTVWSEFGSLAMELGDSVVNLGQGFPDFAPPPFVRESARLAVESDCHQYTRPAGHPPLVEVLAQRYSKHLGRSVNAMQEVAVTVGCSQALYVTMQCLVSPGDEVVLLEPFFDLYIGQIRMAGGVPRYVPLLVSGRSEGDQEEGGEEEEEEGDDRAADMRKGWRIDFETLEATVNERTRAIVLNSPHNPTGKVFSKADMERLAALVERWPEVTVVSDEVYKYTVHGESAVDGHCHFASLPGMFDRTLTLSSAGKTFSVTGWQVGWIVGPSRLLRDVHIALPFLQFCASTPMQQALVEVLRRADEPYGGEASYYDWLCAQYRRKARFLTAALEDAGLPVVQSEGGYFLTVDVSDVAVPQKYLDEPSSGAIDTVTKDWAFCRYLAIEHGVLSIPVAPFYSAERRASGQAGAFARFAFCKSDKTLENAAARLKQLPFATKAADDRPLNGGAASRTRTPPGAATDTALRQLH